MPLHKIVSHGLRCILIFFFFLLWLYFQKGNIISGICLENKNLCTGEKDVFLTFCCHCRIVFVPVCLQVIQGPQIRNLLVVLQI